MGNIAGTDEDSGNNPPQISHVWTVWTLTRTVRDYVQTVRCCMRTVRLGSLDYVSYVVARVHVWITH
jgi:hypothetical protein